MFKKENIEIKEYKSKDDNHCSVATDKNSYIDVTATLTVEETPIKETIAFDTKFPYNTLAFSGGRIANGANIPGYRTYINHFQEIIRWENTEKDLINYGRHCFVINTSKAGDTMATILASYDSVIKPLNTKMVAIMAGLEDCEDGTAINEFKTSLYTLVKKIRAEGKIPILMTPNAVLDNSVTVNLFNYVTAVRELSLYQNVNIVDFYRLWMEQGSTYIVSRLSYDGIVPNEIGHLDMGKQLANSLGSTLSSTGFLNTLVTEFNDEKAPQYKYIDISPRVTAGKGFAEVTLPEVPAEYSIDSYSYEINMKDATMYGSAAKTLSTLTINNLPTDIAYTITVSALLLGTQYKFLRYNSVTVSSNGTIIINNTSAVPVLPTDTTGTVAAVQSKLSSENPITWLFIGDSITHGAAWTYGYDDFSQLFEKRIRNEMGRRSDIIINTGVSGATTTEFLQYKDSRLSRYTPNIAFIMLGMNDCVTITTAEFRKNLAAIVDEVRGKNALPILATPNITEGRADVLPPYIDEIRQIAQEKNVLLIDHFKEWTEISSILPVWARWINAADSDMKIHPDAMGHLKMAQSIFKAIGIYDYKSELSTLDYSSIAVPNNKNNIVDGTTGIIQTFSKVVPEIQRNTNSLTVNIAGTASDYGSAFKNMTVEVALAEGIVVKGIYDPAKKPSPVIYGISAHTQCTVRVSGLITLQNSNSQSGNYTYKNVEFAAVFLQ